MSVTTPDLAQARCRNTSEPVQARMEQPVDTEALSTELDIDRRQHKALVQQNDELLRACSLLTKKVSSLELALLNATQFAQHDELTGLPNRRLLRDRYDQATSLASRHEQCVALLFFDLDEFKSVNDRLGHDAGDKLLQQIAIRLTKAIRKFDTACRYGGDEFVVLLTEIDHQESAVNVLKKIRDELAPPYLVYRRSVRVSVSDGMAIYPRDARSFTDLIRLSDHSMLKAKSGNRGESAARPNWRCHCTM